MGTIAKATNPKSATNGSNDYQRFDFDLQHYLPIHQHPVAALFFIFPPPDLSQLVNGSQLVAGCVAKC